MTMPDFMHFAVLIVITVCSGLCGVGCTFAAVRAAKSVWKMVMFYALAYLFTLIPALCLIALVVEAINV